MTKPNKKILSIGLSTKAQANIMESKPSDLANGVQTFRFGKWSPNLQIWRMESKPSDLADGVQTFRFGRWSPNLQIWQMESKPSDLANGVQTFSQVNVGLRYRATLDKLTRPTTFSGGVSKWFG